MKHYHVKQFLLFSCFLSPLSIAAESCEISDRQGRADQAFSQRMLDRVPSVIESCALSSVTPGGNYKDYWVDIPDDFGFCGFGAQQVWEVAQKESLASQEDNLQEYLSRINESIQTGDTEQEIPIPGTSKNLPQSKVFKHIFKQIDSDS